MRERESDGEGTATCFAFLATLDTLFVFCILVKSPPTSLHLHMYVCVASHPQHSDSPIPSPALLQLHSLCVISKICHCLLPGQAQKRSRRNRKFNFIFMSCNPATLPFPVPLSPSFNACHFCPFSAVSFSPRTVCAKNLIIETLSELEKWNDTNENQPQSDKAVNDEG